MTTDVQSHTSCRTCGKPLEGSSTDCPNCLFQLALDVGTVERASAPAFPTPDQDRLAALMPDFEFLELIGRGGMGAVFKVRQPRLSRLAAMKVLPPVRAADPAFVERFFREAQALAQLSHPNIVDVYDMGQRGSYLYILMEFVEGRPLRESIQNKSIATVDALRLTMDLCSALSCAHAQGIVHRDIKPENVLLSPDGRVKLLDFGLVKLTEDSRLDRFTLTEINLRMGTPQYMAPEQMSGAADIDHRADIYSLGVLLYEMLCGSPPTINYSPPTRKIDVDQRVDRVVEHALRESRTERYQHADDLRKDLEHIIRTPRRRAVVAATMLIGLLACALGSYFVYRNMSADPAPPPGTPIDGVPIAVVPFDAAQARAHQQRWAEHLKVPVEWTNSIGMKFKLIPPGEFTRGLTPSALEKEEKFDGRPIIDPFSLTVIRSSSPAHRVRLTTPFFMAETETTQSQVLHVLGICSSFYRVGNVGESRLVDKDTSNMPAENLGWSVATEFCKKLSKLEGLNRVEDYYRLPTESEWEFAQRGGTDTRFWFGPTSQAADQFEISGSNSGRLPKPVASLRPNPFGLYDMAGNIAEFTSDLWSATEYEKFRKRCAVNPTGPEDGTGGVLMRIVRGGTFSTEPGDLTAFVRTPDPPLQWSNQVGFRVVVPVTAVAASSRPRGS